MKRKKIEVQTHLAHLDRLRDVADGLRRAGMTIVDRVDALGHFSGVAEESAIARLQAVPGVKSVRKTGDEGEPDPPEFSIT